MVKYIKFDNGENHMLLEKFDEDEGIITPKHSNMLILEPLPNTLIAIFSKEILDQIIQSEDCRFAGEVYSINGASPFYIFKKGPKEVLITLALIGGPACIGNLEEFFGQGVTNFILFGTCGVLDSTLKAHQVIVPTIAVRDEGTGYQYLPSSDEVLLNEKNVARLTAFFDEEHVDYIETKVWTTDAFFRETPARAKRRVDSGCQVVDMECSAVACWSDYRNIATYHFFYTADHVDFINNEWDSRKNERQKGTDISSFFELAVSFANTLS